MGKKQFRRIWSDPKATNTTVNYKTKRSFNLQPNKTIICEAQAKSWNLFSKKIENKQNGCSSEKERKVDALALRADEGRDNLR